jgi:ABC-type transporter Mla subunit MlaD
MSLSDRQLGLLTLLVLLGAGLWVSAMMVIKNQQATTRIIAIFDELGSLQPEDPVTSRGFLIGKVGQVSWIDRKAQVEILFDKPMILKQGTTIRNENFSLMGQRRIEININRDGETIDPDHLFDGEFEPGIAEAMHVISQVRNQVIAVRDLVFLLRDGDSTTPSIPGTVEKTLRQSDALLSQLERTLQIAKPKIANTLDDVDYLSNKTIQVSQQTDSALETLASQGTLTIAEAQKLILRVESSVDKLTLFLDKLESQPFSKELLEKKELIEKLSEFVSTLQGVLALFNSKGGLEIIDEQGNPRGLVSLKNINLLGSTAREKARLRIKKQEP